MASNTKVFRLNNLTGGINSMAEENGLITFASQQNPNAQFESRDIENWRPFYQGGQSKAFGFSLFKAIGSAITGLYRYLKADGTSLFIHSKGTNVYKGAPGSLTSIATISSGAYTHFETALDKLIICDGVGVPQTYDGTTTANLSAEAPAGTRGSVWYRNQLFLFGSTADPSLLFYSKSGDISDGYDGAETPNGGFINCDVNDGQKITAVAKYFIPGSLSPILVVGKTRSIGIITGTGTTADPYTFEKVTFDFGIPGFRQIVQVGTDINWLTPNGVASYTVGQYQLQLLYQYISEKVRNQFQALNQSKLNLGIGWYDWLNMRVSWAVPEAANNTPNVIWHYDIRLKCWYKERFGGSYDITAAFVDTDGSVYHGDSAGNIYKHVSTVYDFGGSAIQASYKTAYMDFGNPLVRKRIVDARMTVRSQGQYGLSIQNNFDYGARTGQTNTINVTTGGYTWNGGVWTSDSAVYQWGAAAIQIKRFFPSGLFRSLQMVFTQNGLDQPMDIFEIELVVEFCGLV